MLHGKTKRDVMDPLFAFQDEIRLGNLTKVEAEMGGENWEVRKPKCFTLVFRFGAVADRLERRT